MINTVTQTVVLKLELYQSQGGLICRLKVHGETRELGIFEVLRNHTLKITGIGKVINSPSLNQRLRELRVR